MKRSEKEMIKRWIDTWQRVGPELEAIRRQELTEFNHAADWHAIDDLLDAGMRFARPRRTSGLVEMQKWFMKLAERQGLRPPAMRKTPAQMRSRRRGP